MDWGQLSLLCRCSVPHAVLLTGLMAWQQAQWWDWLCRPTQSDEHVVCWRRKFAIPGFQHKLGLLLHGPPGTGKTSLVKARNAPAAGTASPAQVACLRRSTRIRGFPIPAERHDHWGLRAVVPHRRRWRTTPTGTSSRCRCPRLPPISSCRTSCSTSPSRWPCPSSQPAPCWRHVP